LSSAQVEGHGLGVLGNHRRIWLAGKKLRVTARDGGSRTSRDGRGGGHKKKVLRHNVPKSFKEEQPKRPRGTNRKRTLKAKLEKPERWRKNTRGAPSSRKWKD